MVTPGPPGLGRPAKPGIPTPASTTADAPEGESLPEALGQVGVQKKKRFQTENTL